MDVLQIIKYETLRQYGLDLALNNGNKSAHEEMWIKPKKVDAEKYDIRSREKQQRPPNIVDDSPLFDQE